MNPRLHQKFKAKRTGIALIFDRFNVAKLAYSGIIFIFSPGNLHSIKKEEDKNLCQTIAYSLFS